MRNEIKNALNNYLKNQDQASGHNLIRVMRNGIEVLAGVTVQDLYENTTSFNKLVKLAKTV